jgi:hypothetical protein
MSKKTRPGESFEAQFRASIPVGVYHLKLAAQSPAAFAIPKVERFMRERMGEVPQDMARALGASRFSPRAPYDLMIAAPTGYPAGEIYGEDHLGRPLLRPVLPLQIFALELKSTADPRLSFDKISSHQEKGLAAAGEAGQVAGVVIEFRSVGEVWFVPIQAWMVFRLATEGVSLPLALARRVGMQIHLDEERGTSRLYWKVGKWLRACGAVIPEAVKAPRVAKGKSVTIQESSAPLPSQEVLDLMQALKDSMKQERR